MGKIELNRLVVEGRIFSTFVRPLPLALRQEICAKCFFSRFLSLYKNKPRVIKDPVYGAVALDPEDVFLLDTCFMQRLRYIRQTSFLNYLVPTATHTRFDHSLGVYFWAKNIFKVLEENGELEDLAQEIYQILIEHIRELKRKIEKNDPTIRDIYDDYAWIIKHLDEKALNNGKIILHLNNDLDVFIDNKKFCSLWIKAEYLVVKYAALLHDLAHYPFSHLGEKINEIICDFIFKEIDRIYKEVRSRDIDIELADKLTIILGFWSRCNLCYEKDHCKPYNSCKPHELDAIRLITQKEIKDEKHNIKGVNCIRFSIYYLLENQLEREIKAYEDLKSGLSNQKTAKKVHDLLRILGLHQELLLYKIAFYIQSECFLRNLFDFYYRKKKGNDTVEFTGGIDESDFKKIKYTALDYKIIPINYSLRQLINGSWLDVDKLDYIARDAFFMGLEFKASEFKRIIRGIHLAKVSPTKNETKYVIAIDYKILSNIFSMLLRRDLTDTFILNHRINKAIEEKFFEYLKQLISLKATGKTVEALIKDISDAIHRLKIFRKKTDFVILDELKIEIMNIENNLVSERDIDNSEKERYKVLSDLYCVLTCRGIEKAIGFIFVKTKRSTDNSKEVKRQIEKIKDAFPRIKNMISIKEIPIKDPLKNISKIYIFDHLKKIAHPLSKSTLLKIFGYENTQSDIYLCALYLYLKIDPSKITPKIREELKEIMKEIRQLWNQIKNQIGKLDDIEIIPRYV